jgi:predicted secreted protein
MADTIAALGTKLYKGGGEGVGTLIAELTNIGGPKMSSEFLDVTSHDSVGRYREFVQTLRNAGELAIEGGFIPGDPGQAELYAAFNSGDEDTYTIELPGDYGSWTFDAIVSAFEMAAPFEGKLTFTGTLRITGPAELTPGYGS